MFGIPVKLLIYGGIILAIFAAGWHYKSTRAENARLEKELKTANASIQVLNETKVKYDALVLKEGKQIDEIDKAPASDDGNIAPVLRRTLNSLR